MEFNPLEYEPRILEYWEKNNIHKKSKEKNRKKKPFYFLDGPPYTSGKVHLGHAWNKSLKDMIMRYKRMKGFNVWDRAGYDMHGMPTELKVQEKLKLESKEEIIKFGMENFAEECKKFSLDNLKEMNKDFKRLGIWMDFDNAYMPITKEYIEGIWWLIKKAHENGRLYEGERTVHWDPKAGTALAKHELEYKKVADESVYLKFKVAGTENEYLIIWTTTPWTIPFNLGVMVNPKLNYAKVKVRPDKENPKKQEVWILAKELIVRFCEDLLELHAEEIEIMKGEQLEGLKYHHPFERDIPAYDEQMKNKKVFTVLLSEEYVTTEVGTGLVHVAPGCGPEDYEVGHRYGIKPFNSLTERGVFPEEMGIFNGLTAKKDDSIFVDEFEKKGCLVAKEKYSHDYPYAERSKEPVIFRTTKQWFFRVEDLRENMREMNKKIKWVPDFAGSRNFDNWLANLRDNGITRQRFWGTPFPIWRADDGDYIVVGSVNELRILGADVPEDLHKPWIDDVIIKINGKIYKKIPDILDVWIDAGSASWNCINYPKDKETFERFYPPDFILEGIDQIRGWFNLLFVASMVSMERPAYKAVYMHGFINDASGRKMSKSLGNYILPQEVVEKYGADLLRYYMIGGTKAGIDINYNFEDMKTKNRNLIIFWNIHSFILDIIKNNGITPKDIEKKALSTEDKYILSLLNTTVKDATELFEQYRLDEIPHIIEKYYLELSRTYVQLIREVIGTGLKKEKQDKLDVLAHCYLTILKLLSPIIPMTTETLYIELKNHIDAKKESIHLFEWPNADEIYIDKDLEKNFSLVQEITQAIGNARDCANINARWPIKEAIIHTKDKELINAASKLKDIISKQTNVKEVKISDKFDNVEIIIKPNYKTLGQEYGKLAPEIMKTISKPIPN